MTTADLPKSFDHKTSCAYCRMSLNLCLCPQIPRLDLATRVVLFMHKKEHARITNTGVLAHRVLTNSKILFRGQLDKSVVTREQVLPEPRPAFILYPTAEATVLDSNFLKTLTEPITLICPDGHWGQTKKLIRQEPALQNLRFVKLPEGQLTRYRLRRNILMGRVCTFEAIAQALAVLEGEKISSEMNLIFEKMVTRILWTRGKISRDEVAW